MNWYKISKSLQDIAWDPTPGQDDDYEKVHLKSDMKAILEEVYPKDPDSKGFDIDSEIESAIEQLIEYGGDNSMWKYFLKKQSEDPKSDQSKYFDKIKEKSKSSYSSYYENRKERDEGKINIDPEPPGGGMPPM